MEAATDPAEIASSLQAIGGERGALIGIDGVDHSGKTTLAFDLARRLGGIRVGLDCYIDRSRNAEDYVGLLRIPDLARDVAELVCRFPYVLLDGVCLLAALERAGLTPTRVIYVKKISPQGLWHDGFHIEDFAAGSLDASWLDRSIYRYHLQHQPHNTAAIIYTRSAA